MSTFWVIFVIWVIVGGFTGAFAEIASHGSDLGLAIFTGIVAAPIALVCAVGLAPSYFTERAQQREAQIEADYQACLRLIYDVEEHAALRPDAP